MAGGGFLTDAVVNVEELASMAHQPVVVERHDGWNPTSGEGSHDGRREARQMMNVRGVGHEYWCADVDVIEIGGRLTQLESQLEDG